MHNEHKHYFKRWCTKEWIQNYKGYDFFETCLSEEEKHSEEVSSLIENCDEEGLTKYIGNKYIQSSVKRTKKENKKEISNVQHSFKKSLFNDTEISTQEEEAHSKAEDFRSFVFN